MSASQQPSSQTLRLMSLFEQAEFWSAEGQTERARNLYHHAITQDPTGLARLRYGEFLYQMGHEDEAAREFSAALDIARRQQNPYRRAEASQRLANFHFERGETALAMSYRQQEIAARLLCPAENPAESTPPADFLSLANEALLRGELDYAEQLAEHALKFAQSRNCARHLADAWGTWGGIRSFKSDGTDAAWSGFQKAYLLHCRVRDDSGRAGDLLNLAQVARQKGWWTVTKQLLIKAKKVSQSAGLIELQKQADQFLEEANRVLAIADRTPEWN